MIRTILSQVKQYKRESILTPASIVLECIMEILIPLIMAAMIDNGVSKGNIGYIFRMGAVMIAAVVLALLFGVIGGIYGAKASAGLANNLRKSIFHNIQSFSFSNIDKYSTAGLVTRLTTDITNVQQAYQMILRMFTRSPVTLILALAMTIKISPSLSLIFVVAILFLGCLLAVVIRLVSPIFQRVFQQYDVLNASVQENINGIRVVKSYVREDYEIRKFHKASQKLYDIFVKAEKIIIFNMPGMQLAVYGCILALSWLGAHSITSGSLTTGELLSMFAYTMNILMSLMMLSMVFVMVTMARASAERISEILHEKSDLVNGENPVYHVRDGSVSFEHVSFSYTKDKEKLNLKDVNLNINSGETIGIIGGIGSAKSSLVQLIPRLYDVTDGSLRVGGIDVREYDLETLRSQVAMVLQKNVLFSGTIKENLRWGKEDATDEELIHACQLAQIDDFIQNLPQGYNTFIEQGGTNVSGGQKQRLCIARALLKHPKILILDDSTSAVDTKTDALIRKAFREEIPEITKFIVAQRISSIEDADKVIVLDNGIIHGFGTPQEMLESNFIYREIYESQQKGVGLHEAI